jgi:hypothetical protein
MLCGLYINTVKLKLSGLSPAVFVSIGFSPFAFSSYGGYAAFAVFTDSLRLLFGLLVSLQDWFYPYFQLFPLSFAFQLLFASCQFFRFPVFTDIHSTRSDPSAFCPASAFGFALHSFR